MVDLYLLVSNNAIVSLLLMFVSKRNKARQCLTLLFIIN